MSILTLDDRDPSITYSAGWAKAGSSNEFDGTTSWTAVAGSTAKLTFTGTSIGVYGTIPAKAGVRSVAPISSYSVDGGIPTLFTAPEAANTQFRQLFFQSPSLPDGAHTLTITHPLISDPFFLDVFMIVQTTPSTATGTVTASGTGTLTSASVTGTTSANITSTANTTTSATSTTSSTLSTSAFSSSTFTPVTITVTSVDGTPTSQADAAASSGSSANSTGATSTKSNTGAVVGGILGAIVALFLIVFGFIIWRRRRRERRNSMISNNFWNTGPTAQAAPSKPFALATPPGSPRPNNNAPLMAQNPVPGPYAQRYLGGYTPAPPPHQAQTYGAYAGYGDSAYATDAFQEQPYQGTAYASPSQILSASNGGGNYGRGAPAPANNANYGYDVQGAQRPY